MKKLERTSKGYILAEGEVTGHSHAIAEEVELYQDGNVKFMTTFSPVTITHEEHKPITVEEIGDFTVSTVLEVDHLINVVRQVRD